MVERYRDPSDGRCYGRSKWAFQDGSTPELRNCEVLEYNASNDYFVIRWLHNQKSKKASRFNLVFDREDRERLETRVSEALR